jgi:hypothetical protein
VWLVGVMYKTTDQSFIIKSRNYVDLLLKHITLTYNPELFSEEIEMIYRMVEVQDSIILEKVCASDLDIPKIIVSYMTPESNPNDLNNLYKIVEIMTFHSYSFGERLKSAGFMDNTDEVINYLTEAYLEKPNKALKECICNIFVSLESLTDSNLRSANEIIRNTDIMKAVILLINNNTSEINQAIWKFLNLAVSEGDIKVVTEVFRLNLLDIVCQSLNQTSDTKYKLEFIKSLLHRGKEYTKDYNIVKGQIEKMGTDSIIEQLALSEDKEISNLASQIVENYFK